MRRHENRAAAGHTLIVACLVALGLGRAAAVQVNLFLVEGDSNGDQAGNSVAGIGDINGDGVGDLLIGRYYDSPNGSHSGSIVIVDGISGATLLEKFGTHANLEFGSSVAALGDVNGDGEVDFAVGASGADIGSTDTGRVWVFNHMGNTLAVLDGDTANAHLGMSLAGVGDVTGDGVPDVLAGAPGAREVMLFSGTGGLHARVQEPGPPEFGRSVDGLGDVTGDGLPDIIVGAPPTDSSGFGRVFSCAGGTCTSVTTILAPDDTTSCSKPVEAFGYSVTGVPDLDNDGVSDLVIGAQRDCNGQDDGSLWVFSGATFEAFATLTGSAAWDHLGSSCASVGDVNGDGIPDLLAGLPSRQFHGPGSAIVYSGEWIASTAAGVTPSTASELRDYPGNTSGDQFGFSVTGLGDVNGDGYADYAVGASQAEPNGKGYVEAFAGLHDMCVNDVGSADVDGNGLPDGCAGDCNLNGVPDDLDLIAGTSPDCNSNGIPDECDIADGTSADCDGNGVPDECQVDCNANGVPDPCDIASGTSLDCDSDGVPDECQVDCNSNGIPDICDISTGTSSDCDGDGVPDDCQVDCNSNGIPDTCDLLFGTSADCDSNGIPDDCQSDCNSNGIADICDISTGTSADCDADGIPDECQADCNANGVPDTCDLTAGTSLDCNNNGTPDECDVASGVSQDCDNNGVPDDCDVMAGSVPDCNGNGIPDACDIASGTAEDCDGNGVPDACDLLAGAVDCNGNGLLDACEPHLIQVFGLAAGSAAFAATTGGSLITFAGSGFIDGMSGMSVIVTTPHDMAIVDAADIQASPDGVLLSVVMPALFPGCDCALEPVIADVVFDNGCEVTTLSLAFQHLTYEPTRLLGTAQGDLQLALDAAHPGTCLVLSEDVNYFGEVTLGPQHQRLVVTGANPMSPGATNVDGTSFGGSIPALPAIRLIDTPDTVCLSGLGFRLGNSGIEVTGPDARPLIVGCVVDDNISGVGRGGGITITNGAHPALIRTDVRLNATLGSGGGLLVDDASADVVACRFFSNTAAQAGGEVFLRDTRPELLIADSLISQSPAGPVDPQDVTLGHGGGVAWVGSTIGSPAEGTLLRNTILFNQVAGHGAGVHIGLFVKPLVVGNCFAGNSGNSGTSEGGGLYVVPENRDVVTLCENVFFDNSAQIGGALAFHKKNEGLIERNLIFCNRAVQNDTEAQEPPAFYAPALLLIDCDVDVRHNVIHNNTGASTSQQGGGIHTDPTTGNPQYWDNVLFDNEGWEIFTASIPPAGPPLVDHTAVWQSDATGPGYFNDIFALFGGLGTDIIQTPPQLSNPQCATCLPSAPGVDPWGDNTPLPGSPLLNAGSDGTNIGAVLNGGYAPGGCLPALLLPDCNGNGVPDALDLLADLAIDNDHDGIPDGCSWADLGQALAGLSGPPVLVGSGTLVAGTPFQLSLTGALGSASSTLVIGLSELSAPFKGGVLVPSPDFSIAGLPTDPTGGFQLGALWPPGIPPGLQTIYQWWIPDVAAPHGISASNGLRATAP